MLQKERVLCFVESEPDLINYYSTFKHTCPLSLSYKATHCIVGVTLLGRLPANQIPHFCF